MSPSRGGPCEHGHSAQLGMGVSYVPLLPAYPSLLSIPPNKRIQALQKEALRVGFLGELGLPPLTPPPGPVISDPNREDCVIVL